jgi:hypothetical protein
VRSRHCYPPPPRGNLHCSSRRRRRCQTLIPQDCGRGTGGETNTLVAFITFLWGESWGGVDCTDVEDEAPKLPLLFLWEWEVAAGGGAPAEAAAASWRQSSAAFAVALAAFTSTELISCCRRFSTMSALQAATADLFSSAAMALASFVALRSAESWVFVRGQSPERVGRAPGGAYTGICWRFGTRAKSSWEIPLSVVKPVVEVATEKLEFISDPPVGLAAVSGGAGAVVAGMVEDARGVSLGLKQRWLWMMEAVVLCCVCQPPHRNLAAVRLMAFGQIR